MIVLDYQDRRPIYEQVTDKFQILILNGEFIHDFYLLFI